MQVTVTLELVDRDTQKLLATMNLSATGTASAETLRQLDEKIIKLLEAADKVGCYLR